MRKTWIIAAALFCVAAAAINAEAHGGRRGGMHGGELRLGGMGLHGGIRDSLLADTLGLSAEQKTQLSELRTSFAEKHQALNEELQADVKAILTAEQQAALDSVEALGKGRHHRRKGITLTAEQKTQLEALRAEYQEKEQALRDEYKTSFEAILTTEQLAKLEEIGASVFLGCHGGWGKKGTDSAGADSSATSSITSSVSKIVAESEDTPTAATSWGKLKSTMKE